MSPRGKQSTVLTQNEVVLGSPAHVAIEQPEVPPHSVVHSLTDQ